jgi:predicted porin
MKTMLSIALAAAVTGAHAQSNVTLSGVADAALRQVSNDGRGTERSLVSGGNATSRLVFRGSEDLGAGLSASFWLEHGLALDAGNAAQAAQFWDRRSTVSLASKSLGELRAGRDFVPSYSNWSRYDPFGYVGVGSSSNLISASPLGPIKSAFGSNPNTVVRSSNAVQWLMPSGWGGLEGGVMVAAGEGGTAANGQHKVLGARLGYAADSFGVSAAHTRSTNDLTGDRAFTDSAIGAQLNTGMVRASVAWRRFEQDTAAQTNLLVGAWIPMGQGELKLSWTRAEMSGSAAADSLDGNGARQWALGYVYNLSKRSALYGTVSYLDNEGAHALAVPGGISGMAKGGTSRGVELGMRHTF